MSHEASPALSFSFSSQDSSQIELLKELLDLQKDMIVMMLSLLEGLFFFCDSLAAQEVPTALHGFFYYFQ